MTDGLGSARPNQRRLTFLVLAVAAAAVAVSVAWPGRPGASYGLLGVTAGALTSTVVIVELNLQRRHPVRTEPSQD